jgi:transposase
MRAEGMHATVDNHINELEIFKQRYQLLEKENQKLKSDIIILNDYHRKYLETKERLDLLLYKKFGRSAEQLLSDNKQPLLFAPEAEPAVDTEADENEEKTPVKSYSRNKAGRKPIDPKLPREDRIIDISEEEKTCACGAKLSRIGEETSEKLHIIAPRIFVERIVRLKYACRCCEGTEDENNKTVRIAPVEPSIIPRSIVSPSLLSTIIIQKYEDHLPFYRQETQFSRIGVTISRQDMSNWQQKAYEKLIPLFQHLKETIKNGPVIQMDETQVQVMGEEGRLDTQKSWMWLARGGPPGKPVVLYEYRITRAAYHAKSFLCGYSGYLQTDGYEGYDAAVRGMSGIIHVGCFAHARRKFHEASKATKKPQSAEEGMKHIRKLYTLEDELRGQNLDDKEFLTARKSRAGPILEQFKSWLLKRKEEVPPSLLLGKAIHYSLAQWDKMITYLDSPILTPDNNACENAIRPFVLGRKNWLFNKSPEGAESSCGMYSLIETARQNGLVPANYLLALFEKAPLASSSEDWIKLLPWNIFTP